MWEDYAKQIGKTTDELTQAEKIQAEYNGIMEESKHQVGDAKKLMLELAGTQAKFAKSTNDINKSFGEALAPTLQLILEILIPITESIANFVKNNQELVAVITIVGATLTGAIAVFATGVVVIKTLTGVLATFGLTIKALALNPATIAFTALAVAVGVVVTKMAQAKKEQEAYRANLDKLNKTIQRTESLNMKGIASSEIESYKNRQKALEEYISTFERLNRVYNSTNNLSGKYTFDEVQRLKEINEEFAELNKNAEGLNIPTIKRYGNSEEYKAIKKELQAINRELKIAEANNIDAYNAKAKEIAQQRQSIEETKNLIETYKQAEKGTSDWVDAEKRLAELFPQFSTINGLKIDNINKLVIAQDNANKSAWSLFQDDVRRNRTTLENLKKTKLALAKGFSFSDANNRIELNKELKAINEALAIYDEYSKMDVKEVPGVAPIRKSSSSSSSSEQSAYDQALRLYQHRKNLGQLELQDEINILNDIKAKHVKNADDRMDIEERIYSLKQELRQKELQEQEEALEAQLKLIQEQEERLDARTTNSFRWINRKKLYDEIDEDEEIQAYQRIIKYHKEYLQKIESDEKISQQEKERIREQEIDFIKDQEDKIFSIKKNYIQKSIEEYISGKRAEIDAEEKIENERLKKKLSDIDKEYDDKEDIKKQKKLTDELAKLRAEETKYSNAQTKEGQERLKSIRDNISKITEDMESDRLEKEKALRKESIEQEIEDNKIKYQKLKDDLEQSKKDMLSKASEYAKDIQTEATNASNTLVDAISSLFKKWENQNDSLMESSLKKLQSFITRYTNKMQKLQFGSLLSGGQGLFNIGKLAGLGASVVLNVNDNGDKIINSKDEVIDYTQELFNTAKNGLRTIGGGF